MSARACIVRRFERWMPRSMAKATIRMSTGRSRATMGMVAPRSRREARPNVTR